jgi:glycosyltransferase involved in cell wall biosynthesis
MKQESIRLFHVSTLVEEEKNISGLLRGFSMALKNNPLLHLTVAGFESNWHKLMESEPELKEIPVTYLGSLNAEQIAREMQMADAFLMTSWFENQPVVCIEAWCSGLPIVGVQVGNLNLTMNDQNSVKIKSQKPEDICAAIETFVKIRFGFNKKEIAQQARSQYSSAVVSKQLESLYQIYFKL